MEYIIKPLDAAKQFGRKTHHGQEPALQLTDTQSKFPRERGEIRGALFENYPADRLRHQQINAA